MESVTKLISKVNAIVRFPAGCAYQKADDARNRLQQFADTSLNELAREYGLMLHDADFNEDGSAKLLHAHMVFTLKHRKRKGTIINDLSKFFEVTKPSIVVESYSSFTGSFQYLVHLHNPEKAQYDANMIITNFSEDEVTSIMEEKASSLPDFEALYAIVQNAPMLQDVIKTLGIGVYQRYRMTILDLWRLTHGYRTIV